MSTNSRLGSLTLDLVVKAGAFTAGLTAAERDANKKLSAIEKRANAFGRSLGIGLKTASVAAFGAVSAGMAIYIKNTIEAEKVQAQLTARIKDTMGAAGRSIQQLSAQADNLQSLTIFDDEAIGEAQAMLLTFKQIQGVQFDKTIESALDLATVMGTDAPSAAKLLGRALSDPEKGLTALTRAGVVFTKEERNKIKAMVEAGEKAKAQDAILAKLQGTMGTAAEAARNTLGGAIQGLKNDFDNLLEGDVSKGGLKGTVDAVNQLSETVNDPELKSGIDGLASGLLTAANAALKATAGIGGMINSYAKWLKDQGFMAGKTIDQLEKHRDRLVKERGSLLGKIANANDGSLDKKIAEIDNQIEALKAASKAIFSDTGKMPESFFRPKPKPAQDPDPDPEEEGTGGGGRGRSRSAKPSNLMDDWLTEDREKLQQMAEAAAQANEQFLDMSATYAGPLAVAEREHIKNLAEIAETGREAGRSAEEITALQAKATDAYNEQVAAIRAQKSPAEELIDSLQEEIKWLGATTEEQLKLNAARAAGKGATEQQIEDIYGLMKARQEAQQQADIWNDVERDLSDTFVDLVGNIGDAGNILKDFADRVGDLITRSIADDWANKITDWFKGLSSSGASASGGASGGGIVDWFAGLFSGGMASGGPVQPWSMYEVNEQGMEGLSVGGRDYLLTGSRGGYITPANQMGGRNISQTFVVQGAPDRRTREQMARESGIAARRALMRTG